LVGFEFRGRQGTAVLKGVVVAAEYGEAVEAVVEGFKDDEALERERLRTVEVLKKWRYFLKALRIRQRIGEYIVEGDDQNVEDVSDDPDDEYVGGQSDPGSDYGGGFIPESWIGQ
jgi:xeroderma pigmentosum group C-complementing protein